MWDRTCQESAVKSVAELSKPVTTTAMAPSSSSPAEMPRNAGRIAAIKPTSASSTPIIETVLPNEKLNPSPTRMDPYR